MIIGNGFMANSFKYYDNKSSYIIIYASGIPNIFSYSDEGADREKKLLEKIILDNKLCKIVYFSSCGIYYKEGLNDYSRHKLKMENIIKNISNNYLIVRLPIVVGTGSNMNSLCHYFFNCIKNNDFFYLWKNASRYLIDINDVLEIIKFILDRNYFYNEIVNISSFVDIRVETIVNIIEGFLNKKANYKFCDKGSKFIIDIEKLKKILPESIIYEDNYANLVLEKYYGQKIYDINSKL